MRVEWNKVIRYLAYTLELLVLFMLQETPGLLPPLFGARPVLLFPAVITIAMFETEIPALAFGVVGGLFCDFGLSGTLGFHALVLGVLCFFISLLVRVYLQSNIATALLTGIVGIGLTVCRTIVNAHGGQITAANRPQGGASFCITLPLAEIEEEEHDE